jgi:hypothetical protein
MKYSELKDEIREIAEIANSVPEAFRAQCFATLLEHLLASSAPAADQQAAAMPAAQPAQATPPATPPSSGTPASNGSSIPTPSQIKLFMSKTGVTVTELASIVLYEDNEVHFIKEPTTAKISRGQIEWALLLALKNGISNNAFSVDPEELRSICQEKGFYDQTNFIKNFKPQSTATLFTGAMEKQGAAQKLSNDGLAELGKLIKELSAAAS